MDQRNKFESRKTEYDPETINNTFNRHSYIFHEVTCVPQKRRSRNSSLYVGHFLGKIVTPKSPPTNVRQSISMGNFGKSGMAMCRLLNTHSLMCMFSQQAKQNK